MQHTFPTAAFAVGEGPSRHVGTARDVVLTADATSQAGAAPYLRGQIRAEGMLFEECRPNRSLLAVGREAVLKLAVADRWSQVGVLIMKLGEIRTPGPGKRLYEWSFLVTGRPTDPLRLFPERRPGEVGLEELLALVRA
jgi:hypothetical protein